MKEAISTIIDSITNVLITFFNMCYSDGHVTKIGIISIIVIVVGLSTALFQKNDSHGNAFLRVFVVVVLLTIAFAIAGTMYMQTQGWM